MNDDSTKPPPDTGLTNNTYYVVVADLKLRASTTLTVQAPSSERAEFFVEKLIGPGRFEIRVEITAPKNPATEQTIIKCPQCGITSNNPSDIRERYCGRCAAFHADMKIVRGI